MISSAGAVVVQGSGGSCLGSSSSSLPGRVPQARSSSGERVIVVPPLLAPLRVFGWATYKVFMSLAGRQRSVAISYSLAASYVYTSKPLKACNTPAEGMVSARRWTCGHPHLPHSEASVGGLIMYPRQLQCCKGPLVAHSACSGTISSPTYP